MKKRVVNLIRKIFKVRLFEKYLVQLTIDKPFGSLVTKLPPRIETITPPTIAVITPAIGGASLAIASPRPRGNAIRLTTNPENMF